MSCIVICKMINSSFLLPPTSTIFIFTHLKYLKYDPVLHSYSVLLLYSLQYYIFTHSILLYCTMPIHFIWLFITPKISTATSFPLLHSTLHYYTHSSTPYYTVYLQRTWPCGTSETSTTTSSTRKRALLLARTLLVHPMLTGLSLPFRYVVVLW